MKDTKGHPTSPDSPGFGLAGFSDPAGDSFQTDPEHIPGQLTRAWDLLKSGRGNEAASLLRRMPLNRLEVLVEARKMSSFALEAKDGDTAVALVRIIVEQMFKDPQAHNNLGAVLLMADRPREAYWELDLVRQLEEGDKPLFVKNLAQAVALCGQWSQAAVILENLIDSAPASELQDIKALIDQFRRMAARREAAESRALGLEEANPWRKGGKDFLSENKDVLILVPSGYYVEECCVGPNRGLAPGAALLLAAYLRGRGYNPVVTCYGASQETVVSKPRAAVFYAPWVSFTTVTAPVVKRLKNIWPDVPAIMVMYESLADFELRALKLCPELDYAVLPNEKELSVGLILEHGSPCCPGGFGEKTGIVYRDEAGCPQSTGLRTWAPDLSHLPYMGSELELFLKNNPQEKFSEATIVLQRGCPQACTYCPLRASRFRHRDPQVVAKEIAAGNRLLGRSGLLSLEHFKDPRPLDALCDLLLAEGTLLTGGVGARSEYVTDVEFLRKLGRTGIQCLYLGLEGATEAMRRRLKKFITDEQMATAVQNIRRAGLAFTSAFITGLPWEDAAYYRQMYALVKELISIPQCIDIHLSKLIPFTGLPVTADLIKEGIMPRPLEFEDWQDRRIQSHNYPSKHLSIAQLDQRFFDLSLLIRTARQQKSIVPPTWTEQSATPTLTCGGLGFSAG